MPLGGSVEYSTTKVQMATQQWYADGVNFDPSDPPETQWQTLPLPFCRRDELQQFPSSLSELPTRDEEAYKTYLEGAFADPSFRELAFADPQFRDVVAKILYNFGQRSVQDAAVDETPGSQRQSNTNRNQQTTHCHQVIQQQPEPPVPYSVDPALLVDASQPRSSKYRTRPRFSKNGKRLGRPPKSQVIAKSPTVSPLKNTAAASAAHDCDADDRAAGLVRNGPMVGDETSHYECCDLDVHWEDVAKAMNTSAVYVHIGSRTGAILSDKTKRELLSQGSAIDVEPDEAHKLKLCQLYQQLRKTLQKETAKNPMQDTDSQRKSGRERKQVEFPGKVPWQLWNTERKLRYKISMLTRKLRVKGQQDIQQTMKDAQTDLSSHTTVTPAVLHAPTDGDCDCRAGAAEREAVAAGGQLSRDPTP